MDDIGQYSIRLMCILTDHHPAIDRRQHDIAWWYNNKRLGSQTNRFARIVKNVSQHSMMSTLFYTGQPINVIGHYVCESDRLRRTILVQFESNNGRSSECSTGTMNIKVDARPSTCRFDRGCSQRRGHLLSVSSKMMT
jgi:hypothetical protein